MAVDLPKDSNVPDTWKQDANPGKYTGDFRAIYTYTASKERYTCFVYYGQDGKINLLVNQDSIDTLERKTASYFLMPSEIPQHVGSDLTITSSRTVLGNSGFTVHPTIFSEDLFTKTCMPQMPALLGKLSRTEVDMWNKQYGSVFPKH